MDPVQSSWDAATITALFAGLAILIAAIGKVILDLRVVKKDVNSNMTDAMAKIDELHATVARLVAEAEATETAKVAAAKARRKRR